MKRLVDETLLMEGTPFASQVGSNFFGTRLIDPNDNSCWVVTDVIPTSGRAKRIAGDFALGCKHIDRDDERVVFDSQLRMGLVSIAHNEVAVSTESFAI